MPRTDLPLNYRNFVKTLGEETDPLDVTSVLNDDTLQLSEDGWAIKLFAVLASTFEQVMRLDADTVLLQPPEAILIGRLVIRIRALFFPMTIYSSKVLSKIAMRGGRSSLSIMPPARP